MGEQTQVQTQTQTQSHTHTHSPAQTPAEPPHHDSIDATTIAEVSPTPTELSNAPAQTSSPPSKIPFRPRKIRKLSPVPSDPNSSQQIVALPETPKPSAAKLAKSKAVHQRAVPVPKIAGRPLSCEGEVEAAIRHLRSADPLLAQLIDIHQPPFFGSFQTPFLALTRSILSQQLANKAGASIYNRFVGLCGGEDCVVPETVLAQTPQQLRQIGISGRKASYLHDLARKYQNGILSDAAIVNMDDKSLFTMLTMVNGIGSWSVHMFMIFSLHRPDVLPINDLGIRKGVRQLYNLDDMPRPSQMEQLCDKWRPYRSVAAWYMWRFTESKGAPCSAAAVAAGASLPLPLQQQEPQQQQHPQHPQQQQLMDSLSSLINIGNSACIHGELSFSMPCDTGPVPGDLDREWN